MSRFLFLFLACQAGSVAGKESAPEPDRFVTVSTSSFDDNTRVFVIRDTKARGLTDACRAVYMFYGGVTSLGPVACE